MNDDNGYTIYCSRCGEPMNSNSRYCMKCGNLNYDHPANKNMQKFINKDNNNYQVGEGKIISEKSLEVSEATNTGNPTLCFIVNFSIYLILILICLLSYLSQGYDFQILIFTQFPLLVAMISILMMYIYK